MASSRACIVCGGEETFCDAGSETVRVEYSIVCVMRC